MNYKQKKMKTNRRLNVLKTLCAFSLIFFYMPLTFQAHATEKSEALKNVEQDITVQGKVIDENGEGIIGASILVVRTNGGTITDLDGNFRLSARSGDELRVSYVGYETQTGKVNSANITI